jgi:hypothetical protein
LGAKRASLLGVLRVLESRCREIWGDKVAMGCNIVQKVMGFKGLAIAALMEYPPRFTRPLS